MAQTRWSAMLLLIFWFLGAERGCVADARETSLALGSPKAVAEAYLRAWVNCDWEVMYSLLDSKTRGSITLQQFKEIFQLRVPLDEELSYFAPNAYAGLKVEREEKDFAIVSYTIGFRRERYLGKSLARIADAEKRKVASNEERYRMRIQSVILLSDLHNTRSPYVDITLVLRVKVREYIAPLSALIEDEMRPYYPYIESCTAPDAHNLSPELLQQPSWEYILVTSWASSAVLHNRPMLLLKEGNRWVVANAVIPLTNEMRAQACQRFHSSIAVPQAQAQEARWKTVKLLADILGLLD